MATYPFVKVEAGSVQDFHGLLMEKFKTCQPEITSMLRQHQTQILHLTRTGGSQQAIDVSLLPIVIEDENWAHIVRAASASLLARFALVADLEEGTDLFRFLTSGLDPITTEILTANLTLKPYHRSRIDSIVSLSGKPSVQIIENNGGEPQADVILNAVQDFVTEVLQLVTGNTRLRLGWGRTFGAVFNRLMSEYQKIQEKSDALPPSPNFGFFAFKSYPERRILSSISNEDATHSARILQEEFGLKAVAFDPFDITGWQQVTVEGKGYWIPEVNGLPVHVIRRYFGENFENLSLWKRLKNEYPETYYRFTGVFHPEHNPESFGPLIMMNGHNSVMTDKKLDVIIREPELRRRFRLRERLEMLVSNRALLEELGAAEFFKASADEIIQLLDLTHPVTRMMRRQGEGLYHGSDPGDTYGMSAEEVAQFKAARKNWVIKLDSLDGHSGVGVIVGRAFKIHHVPADIFRHMSERDKARFSHILDEYSEGFGFKPEFLEDLWMEFNEFEISADNILGRLESRGLIRNREFIREMTVLQVIAHVFAKLPEDCKEELRQLAWNALVEYVLTRDDSLGQEAVELQYVPTCIIGEDGHMPLEPELLSFDVDPQAIGAGPTYLICRVSRSKDLTNVSGGHGGFGYVIRKSDAEQLFRSLKS